MEHKLYTGGQILDALSAVGIGAGNISEVMSCLSRLPSAEPEIIYCQECIKADLCAWRREGAEYCSYAGRK